MERVNKASENNIASYKANESDSQSPATKARPLRASPVVTSQPASDSGAGIQKHNAVSARAGTLAKPSSSGGAGTQKPSAPATRAGTSANPSTDSNRQGRAGQEKEKSTAEHLLNIAQGAGGVLSNYQLGQTQVGNAINDFRSGNPVSGFGNAVGSVGSLMGFTGSALNGISSIAGLAGNQSLSDKVKAASDAFSVKGMESLSSSSALGSIASAINTSRDPNKTQEDKNQATTLTAAELASAGGPVITGQGNSDASKFWKQFGSSLGNTGTLVGGVQTMKNSLDAFKSDIQQGHYGQALISGIGGVQGATRAGMALSSTLGSALTEAGYKTAGENATKAAPLLGNLFFALGNLQGAMSKTLSKDH